MAEPVPEDDLPGNLVPEDDLPQDAAPAAEPAKSVGPSTGEALVRSLNQGLSAGWSDEMQGVRSAAAGANPVVRGLITAIPFVGPVLAPSGREVVEARANPDDRSFGERYRAGRNVDRAANEAARAAHGNVYLAGELGGALAPALLTGGASAATGAARTLPVAAELAAQGAAQGAGYSNADTARGLASDTALGGALGLAGGAAGKGLGKVFDWVARKGAGVVRGAGARAATQAADEATSAVQSLEGAARERAANAYRQMERIQNALQDPALPASDRAALEAFKQSPEYAALVTANAKGVLSAAPDALAEREAAAAIAQGERAALPEAITKRTGELLSGSAAKEQIMARAKRYILPGIGSLAGTLIGGPVGGGVGALAGAGTRPMMQALLRMAKHPAVASRLGSALESSGEALGATARGAARMAPTAAALGVTGPGEEYEPNPSQLPPDVAAYLKERGLLDEEQQ